MHPVREDERAAAWQAEAGRLADAGRFGDSLALLDHALRVHEGVADLHTARGWALENLGPDRLADARLAYERAMALDAGQLWAQLGLATVLGQLDDTAGSRQLFHALIGRAAARMDQETDLAELAGWCQYRVGDFEGAIATFRQALALDEDWLSVRFDLGLALLVRGDEDGAQREYRCALARLGTDQHGQRLGLLLVALDDLEQAMRQRPAGGVADLGARIRDELARFAASRRDRHV